MENPFATIDDTSSLFDSHNFTNVKIGEKSRYRIGMHVQSHRVVKSHEFAKLVVLFAGIGKTQESFKPYLVIIEINVKVRSSHYHATYDLCLVLCA
jgi:hypothetical protein